jgi:cobalt-zinc-cadmium resistance protein CzcA
MFQPMAITLIIALVWAFVLSVTLVPALVALLVTGKVSEKDNFAIRGIQKGYAPLVDASVKGRWGIVSFACVLFIGSLWCSHAWAVSSSLRSTK